MALVKPTLNERRAQLTERVVAARQEWQRVRHEVNQQIRKANPGGDYWDLWDQTDSDKRVAVAEARLLALCDAANIMGAEIF
jgi:vacuolar-type H+-ATPase subunit D/Vma8